jgi:putative tryptophan/tyrosine transport system substrate-binding protein
MIRRRDFITLLGGGAAGWPLAARAQQAAVPAVGFLNWGSSASNKRLVAAFRQGLAEVGYIDGQNVTIEFRWADGDYGRLSAMATDLVQRQVAVIVATGTSGTALAVKAVTSTIPIVVMAGGDRVKYGLAASLNRPGGNVTGVTAIATDLAGKRLDLLRELVPQAKTVAYLSGGPSTLKFEDEASNVVEVASALGWEVVVVEARSDRDFEQAFATIVQRKAGALMVGVVPHFMYNSNRIVGLAERYKIPTIYPFRIYVVRGGLMSYDANQLDLIRQVGVDYVGRILKGAKPGDFPIRQPTKFELVINLKTAKSLGLEFPPIMLARADEVIE